MPDIVSKISIDVYPYDWFYINTSEDWGRSKVSITVAPHLIESIEWVKTYKNQLEEEAKIRSENPAVATQYECYQAMLKLVKNDHIP